MLEYSNCTYIVDENVNLKYSLLHVIASFWLKFNHLILNFFFHWKPFYVINDDVKVVKLTQIDRLVANINTLYS